MYQQAIDEESKDEGDAKSTSSLMKGLKSGLLYTVGTLGASASFSMIGVYRLHYTGEFEYKGISAEYQASNKNFQNMTTYGGDGNVVLSGLSR